MPLYPQPRPEEDAVETIERRHFDPGSIEPIVERFRSLLFEDGQHEKGITRADVHRLIDQAMGNRTLSEDERSEQENPPSFRHGDSDERIAHVRRQLLSNVGLGKSLEDITKEELEKSIAHRGFWNEVGKDDMLKERWISPDGGVPTADEIDAMLPAQIKSLLEKLSDAEKIEELPAATVLAVYIHRNEEFDADVIDFLADFSLGEIFYDAQTGILEELEVKHSDNHRRYLEGAIESFDSSFFNRGTV
jgi:hypothetical protein